MSLKFLNGVCRHEHFCEGLHLVMTFLNGVCRHEQTPEDARTPPPHTGAPPLLSNRPIAARNTTSKLTEAISNF